MIDKSILPAHWEVVNLGDFIDKIEAGKSHKCDERPPKENEVGIIKVSAVTWGEFNQEESKTILTDSHFNEGYLIKKGDFLFSRANTLELVGTCVIVKSFDKKLMLSDKILRFVLSENLSKDYLLYYLRSKIGRSEIESLASGNQDSMRNIGQQRIRQIRLPYPPLYEQQEIVAKIEELFSELDKGKEQLETALKQLKVYRQAVLKWAFEGKFTNSNGGWQKVKLGEVANAVDPQPSHRTPPIVEGGIPYVSTKDFDHATDTIDFSKARLVSPDVLEEHLNRYELQQGDFVIGKIGTIGKPVRLVLPQTYTLSANIVLIQPRKVNTTYLYYFFQSSIIEKELLAGTRATTQAAFGIQKVRELIIHLPSKEEQEPIVQEIEGRLSVCDKVEETITKGIQQAETLRQSILKQAFQGKL